MVEENGKRKRGGGPKTAAGKAIVRRNPIKHGVLAQTFTDDQLQEGLHEVLNALHASIHQEPPSPPLPPGPAVAPEISCSS